MPGWIRTSGLQSQGHQAVNGNGIPDDIASIIKKHLPQDHLLSLDAAPRIQIDPGHVPIILLFSAERLGSPDYDGDLLCPHAEPLREAERGPEIYPAKTGVRDKVIPIPLFTTKGS